MKLLEEDIKLVKERKYRNILTVCGMGTILLGCWTIIKMIIYMLLVQAARESIEKEALEVGISTPAYLWLNGIISVVYLMIKFRAGIGAMREGAGGKVKVTYLILVAFLMVASIGMTLSALDKNNFYWDAFDRMATFAIQLISAWVHAEILLYSIKLKKLTEPVKQKGE